MWFKTVPEKKYTYACECSRIFVRSYINLKLSQKPLGIKLFKNIELTSFNFLLSRDDCPYYTTMYIARIKCWGLQPASWCCQLELKLVFFIHQSQNQNFVAITFQSSCASKNITAQDFLFLAFLCDLGVFRFLVLFSVLYLCHNFTGMSTGIKMVGMFTSFFLGSLFTAVAWVNMFVILKIVMLVLVKMAFRHFQAVFPSTPRLLSFLFTIRITVLEFETAKSTWKAMAAHAQTICFAVQHDSWLVGGGASGVYSCFLFFDSDVY